MCYMLGMVDGNLKVGEKEFEALTKQQFVRRQKKPLYVMFFAVIVCLLRMTWRRWRSFWLRWLQGSLRVLKLWTRSLWPWVLLGWSAWLWQSLDSWWFAWWLWCRAHHDNYLKKKKQQHLWSMNPRLRPTTTTPRLQKEWCLKNYAVEKLTKHQVEVEHEVKVKRYVLEKFNYKVAVNFVNYQSSWEVTMNIEITEQRQSQKTRERLKSWSRLWSRTTRMETMSTTTRRASWRVFVTEEASRKMLVFDASYLKSWRCLAWNVRFGSLLLEKLRKPHTKCSFSTLLTWKVEEASHEMLVLEACGLKSWGFGSFRSTL